jgi:Arc/MetJ-type ribon-helix-helix transcriptional regulator
MCVFKPYLDPLPSESDQCGFVVRFGLKYLTQKRFGPERRERGEREERETERERNKRRNRQTNNQGLGATIGLKF